MSIRRGRRISSWLNRKFNEIRKALFFPPPHTGATTATSITDLKYLQTRPRKKTKVKQNRSNKFFKVFSLGVIVPSANENVIKFQSHKRKIKPTKPRKNDRQFKTFHTGFFTVDENLVKFQSRKRKIQPKMAMKYRRTSRFMMQWHTGLTPPPPVVLRDWVGVKLSSHTKRGGY